MAAIKSEVRISAGDTYIELLALYAEALGMNAENQRSEVLGETPPYDEKAFMKLAEQMRALKEASDNA